MTDQLDLPLISDPDIPEAPKAPGQDLWYDLARRQWIADPFDAWLSDEQLAKKCGNDGGHQTTLPESHIQLTKYTNSV